MKRARSKNLMLEDYLNFFVDHDTRPLTLDHLNAIISMNGLCRRKVKREVMEDLKDIVIMSPKRSTLNHRTGVYPCAPLMLDEIKADIKSIGWEDCPIGSIVAVGSTVEREPSSPVNLSGPISTTTASSSGAVVAAAPLKAKKKRRKKRVKTADAMALVPV